jgi:hypothetical protein
MFAEGSLPSGINENLFFVRGTNALGLVRHNSQRNFRLQGPGNLPGARVYSDGITGSHVWVVTSYDANSGDNGNAAFFADYFGLSVQDLGSKPDFLQETFIGGRGGDGGVNNPTYKMRKLMIIAGPLDLASAQLDQRTVVALTDSWGVIPQYQTDETSGGNNYPPPEYIGYMDDPESEVGGSSYAAAADAGAQYRNLSLFGRLHKSFAAVDVYLTGQYGKIHGFGRSGTRILPTGGKVLSERFAAMQAATDSAGPPYPEPGVGPGNADIILSMCGINDLTVFSSDGRTIEQYTADFIAAYKVNLDEIQYYMEALTSDLNTNRRS